jgi:CheY-like chemotaxis protein
MLDKKNSIVLLAEDSEDDAFFFRRTLQKSALSCQVHHGTNGAGVIDYLQNASASNSPSLPELIFLDLKTPLLNGFEVLEWMRTQDFPAPMQVVVLSGSERQEDKERAARLGATDFLVKPLKVSDLHRFVGEHCPSQMGARL